MSSAVDTREALHEFLLEQFPLATEEVLAADLSLVEHGVVDSLGVLGIVSFLEEAFGILVSDEEIVGENFETLSALTRFVESKREAPA
ncbi:MAG: acyl carrier protein [Planctomycetaceae bacterium]